uniref:PIH1 domain-containing protein 2 n=1 Tax=Sphenodon punctatus TaxID=8508 RepID=A0A8D0L730_SPHPU
MEAPRRPEGMLTQLSQFWTMLDEMAENTPESYHRFMQQQLKEAKQYNSPPEPHLCLQTHILEPREKSLFINLCRWERIPAPQSPTTPVPISIGLMEEIADESELYTVIDVAYNPTVLQGEENQLELDHLIRLSLKYIEERYSLTLSHSYLTANCKLKGNLERMKRSLRGGRVPALHLKSARNEPTLDQLRNIVGRDHGNNSMLLKEVTPPKQRLIEEMAGTELPEESNTPVYEITVMKDANGKPQKMELKVELPTVRSVSECDLRVSKEDVMIDVPGKYRLQLDLPASANESATTAAFSKRRGVLLITMPVS